MSLQNQDSVCNCFIKALNKHQSIREIGPVTAELVLYHPGAKKTGKPSGSYLENASGQFEGNGKVLKIVFPKLKHKFRHTFH